MSYARFPLAIIFAQSDILLLFQCSQLQPSGKNLPSAKISLVEHRLNARKFYLWMLQKKCVVKVNEKVNHRTALPVFKHLMKFGLGK